VRTSRLGLIVAADAVLLTVLSTLVLLRHGRPLPGDLTVHRWAVHHRPGGLRESAVLITSTGTGVFPYLLALLAGALTGSGPYARALSAVRAAAALLVVQLLRWGLVTAIGRHRPPATDWAVHVTGLAFPSGHTVTSAAAAGILVCALWSGLHGTTRAVVSSCVTIWAIAVGLSRVYLGVHWPTDVLGGWSLTILLLGSAGLFLRRRSGRLTRPRVSR
jgi:membrane-associated phospholipid phosphatase